MHSNLNTIARAGAALFLLLGMLHLPLAQAQDAYPNKPVRIVIGFGPGSGTDILARMIGEELRVALGQPFVVDNRPGAGAQIAASFVAKAPADGYTLFLTSNSSHSVNPHIFKKLPYDPIADFTPVGGLAYFPFVLAVNAALPVRTPQEFVSYATNNTGKFFYAYGTPTVQLPAEANLLEPITGEPEAARGLVFLLTLCHKTGPFVGRVLVQAAESRHSLLHDCGAPVMAKKGKSGRELIRLVSTADTGYFYTTSKNRKRTPDKLVFKKYDPVVRKHVDFKESKI